MEEEFYKFVNPAEIAKDLNLPKELAVKIHKYWALKRKVLLYSWWQKIILLVAVKIILKYKFWFIRAKMIFLYCHPLFNNKKNCQENRLEQIRVMYICDWSHNSRKQPVLTQFWLRQSPKKKKIIMLKMRRRDHHIFAPHIFCYRFAKGTASYWN